MILVDTNVLSELRKASSGRANPNVVQWASQIYPSQLFISVISILEIETGILQVERRDPIQGAVLRQWLENSVLIAFEGRILPINLDIVRKCASLHVPDPRSDRDAFLAATAIVNQMTVATRNTKDFLATRVPLINPWKREQNNK